MSVWNNAIDINPTILTSVTQEVDIFIIKHSGRLPDHFILF
ncbi:hypothetical protein [Siminovitchia terrae]|nr:hypothetical protein [Siminovitchia terrae]